MWGTLWGMWGVGLGWYWGIGVLGVCEVIGVYMVLANSRPFLNQSYLHGGHVLKGGRGDF